MKVALATVLAALTLASPASASAATIKQQVNVLRSQVGTLQKQVRDLAGAVVMVNDKDTCSTALSFDVHRIIAIYVGIGDIGRLDDAGACARIGVTRDSTSGLNAMRKLASATPQLEQLVDVQNELAQVIHHHR